MRPRKKFPIFLLAAGLMFSVALILFVTALLLRGSGPPDRETFAAADAPSANQGGQLATETAPLESEIEALRQQVADLEAKAEALGAERKTAAETEEAAVQAYVEIQRQLQAANEQLLAAQTAAEEAVKARDQAQTDKERVVALYEKLWRAMTYFDEGRYDECKALLDEMAALNPEEYLLSTSDGALVLTPAAKYRQMLDYFE